MSGVDAYVTDEKATGERNKTARSENTTSRSTGESGASATNEEGTARETKSKKTKRFFTIGSNFKDSQKNSNTEKTPTREQKNTGQKKYRNKAQMDVISQFILASHIYRNQVNPGMTDRQLAARTEALRNTSMDELSKSGDVAGVQYKAWINYMENMLKNKGVNKPNDYIYNLINNTDIDA